MNKKRIIIVSIIAIVLVIGGSFAYWALNIVQTSTNNIATACFDLSLSEDNPINLQSAFPIRDSEGASLTPYEFTITNNCSTYAYYEVNLEVLNNTNLDSRFIKIQLDDEEPVLLSSKIVTTTTLSNASTSYKLAKAYMQASESKTYHLRLWIDENVTLADNITEKEFTGKITIRATYKPEAPSSQEECELEYGEGAAVCSIIANADPTNSKCLQVYADGSIKNPASTMSDSDTPIICTMEDDYGTSYYLRGNHQDNNVKFANMCWKLIRVTGTGGMKLIYNGDLDANGKCTTTSGNHIGFTGQTLSLRGNKVYGTSYTYDGSTYTLTDTSTLNWSTDSASIIGKYTCGNTSTSCADPYYVIGEYSAYQGYVIKLNQSTNYAQIGTSIFNNYTTTSNLTNSSSPAYVGYMYNDTYPSQLLRAKNSGATILYSQSTNNTNYYYGDTISYSGGYYYITNQGGSDVVQLSWEDNYQNNLVGKYTCMSPSKYNDTTLRCDAAFKVLDTTTQTNYMIAEILTNGRLATGTIKVSNGYTDNQDGTYILNSPVTEMSAMEWHNGYSNYNNYYVCEDWNQSTCTNMYKIVRSSQKSFGEMILVSNNYYYGSSFTYDETNPTNPYTLTDTAQFWDVSNSNNQTLLNTHRYTCFNANDNTCTEMYFVYYLTSSPELYYIKLNGNEKISDALDKMLRNDDINVKNSTIKRVIDWWYEQNLRGTEYVDYLEDTVFCGDRTIIDLGGWTETANVSSTVGDLKLNLSSRNYYLKCPNKRDAYTVSDTKKGNGSLTYPVGLLNHVEHTLTGNYTVNNTGEKYWTISPSSYVTYNQNISQKIVGNTGNYWIAASSANDYYGSRFHGVRPSISLKPGTTFKTGGDGSVSNPYEVQ